MIAGWLEAVAPAAAVLGTAVLIAQVLALDAWPARESPAEHLPPISLLKPLYREGPRLYECLRSFCSQDYPAYEIVFGVQDAHDPAIAVVRRLQAEFPQRILTLVIDATRRGGNAKVDNLTNMMTAAHHDILVLADADIAVGPDYLRALAGPVQDPAVGIVTCLYKGVPGPGLWSRVGALFIQDWFVPQVLLAHALGSRDFAFGATIALRRAVLAACGGFEALGSQLADDYVLGARTRALGLRTVLSSYRVDTMVDEAGLRDLAAHELRWLRTIRVINPWGYVFSGVTFGLPLALAAAVVAPEDWVWGMAFLALIMRLVLHSRACRRLEAPRDFGLAPLADVMLCGLWAVGLAGRTVRWRGATLAVGSDGSIKVNRE
ncbi:bacteriohopanetetrol glucosamine biosynthesis glycosyltransferase HpnI [Acidiferrobacter sp.]|uniref:bacteriohopanetetrol glucosamine biosynthesis glycosyltransferase HpnI n=1 Tax=Acidiferrobacter sp. TaxID=1872107 RepID=UPI0026182FE3|nr:bacteriohopanetetrol glucosamine biosynthesis glycosyltransferase HpnI [Acidiferrobacter sp.]